MIISKRQLLAGYPFLNYHTVWGSLFLVAIAFSFYATGIFKQNIFNPNGIPQLSQFFQAAFHPDLSPQILTVTYDAAIITFAYAVCGTFCSIFLGIIGGLLASEIWWLTILPRNKFTQPTWLIFRGLLAIPRAIHELIWGLFLVNIWGLDPLVGIAAIAIPFGATVAKVFSEILDETPRQPLQSLLNSGVTPLTAFIYTLIPQAFLNLVSYTFYRFECSLRSAAVLGIIGAGGLGYQIFLSLQSLRYEQLWTFFYTLFILNGIVDLTSALLRRHLGCKSRLDIHTNKSSPQPTNHPRLSAFIRGYKKIPFIATLTLTFLIPFSFWYINADFSKIWAAKTRDLLTDILADSFPPSIPEIQQLWLLSGQTLAMSILAIALAAFGGMLFSFPAATNFFLPGGLLNPNPQLNLSSIWAWLTLLLARAILLFCRAIPAPIIALVVVFVIFPGILPGAIALGIHNLGILGRLKAENLENLDQRPILALKAQGTPAASLFLYGVLPLSLPRFLAYDLYRWEVCLRETVIVGLVGAGGLGRLLTEQLSSFDYQKVVVTLGCFVWLTFVVDWLSGLARRGLR
ncbi:MAG: ABC transporter permease subunit [Oscillatoria sp. PMC 1051.18]|nr:ABC transporter permease subunit [Oscillatoria sp. PMC 1050.18]MEC5029544.1 ABC transporter permease subunit [Oscillatoria sp. PMC 1051.18]